MSKTKTKSAPKATKPDTVLTKVKTGAVTKPAKNDKAKSKEVAKQVAAKEEKKNKKKVPVKEPTPDVSSEEEESDSASSSEDDTDSDSETEVKGSNGVKVPVEDASSDDSEDDSDESASEDEAPKVNGAATKAKATAPAAASDDEIDSDEAESSGESDSESEDEAPKTKVAAAAKEADSASSDEDSDKDASSDDSADSDESEAEEKPKTTKRKAEDDAVPAAKKSKVDNAAVTTSPNLFVGNLSWNVDEEWLRSEFEQFGELSGVRLMTDRATGRSKGFGYVEFVNAADAAKAHATKQGAELDGRVMNVDFANARNNDNSEHKQDNRRKSYGDQLGEPSDTLFLGNLSFDCTNDDISEAFGPHGTVMGVRLPTDRETGNPKGFGYVTFASVQEATAALEAMQGGFIKSRTVRVDYSQPRQSNGDSPARGGFGGGFGGGRGGRGRGGGRGDFGGRGGRGGGGRGGRGGRPPTTNRGGFGDFSGRKTTF